jgi:signal transduction histidine kinase
MNIIMNSSEAIEQGNIWIKTWKRANNIFIEFKDDGKGISEEDLKVIFDPFFTTKENGTGLGLSLSYRIIQNHGGTINVESEVGVGTKITIKLPMVGEND